MIGWSIECEIVGTVLTGSNKVWPSVTDRKFGGLQEMRCNFMRPEYIYRQSSKRSGHYMYRTVVTICTTSLTFNNSTFCPNSVFMCFVWISEQTAIISLYNINWVVCITERECLLRGTDCTLRLRRLAAGISLRRTGFDIRPVHGRFVVETVVLMTEVSVSISVFPCQCHSTNTAYCMLLWPGRRKGKAKENSKSSILCLWFRAS